MGSMLAYMAYMDPMGMNAVTEKKNISVTEVANLFLIEMAN
jgi:hypothetical protein